MGLYEIKGENNLHVADVELSYENITKLEANFGSPLYILNVNKLRENYRKMETAFKKQYPKTLIGYSYKTNYLPYLCKELSKLGAYAEVVSRLEYDLAIKIGENPKRIIFNGPLKSKEDVHYALKNKSKINLDSYYELDFVKEYALINPTEKIKIGMRVNFDLSKDEESSLQNGYKVSRFGICVENGNLEKAIRELMEFKNIQIVGFHGHFSTRTRSVDTYRKITLELCKLAKKYIPNNVEYIDVGGGMYGELHESFEIVTPTFDEYAEAIGTVMNDQFADTHHKPLLIIEPGVSMVANVISFVSKVIEIKTIQNQQFVLVDGSVHNIKPTMHTRNLPMKILRHKGSKGHKETFNIVGYTCMEKDYLAHNIHDGLPQRDDYIVFENVGAYTIVFNPPFIKERPCIVAFDSNKIFLTRKSETFKQFFNEELYCFSKGDTDEYLTL
ncbi:diaminopimelate decarboxylase [Robertmurraya korlensis]|uniref:diaminopimelate decarboxylase n=1 Tax=Robertmurraya korlensis TaxID=519977 RepID=UPI003527D88C